MLDENSLFDWTDLFLCLHFKNMAIEPSRAIRGEADRAQTSLKISHIITAQADYFA